MSWRSDELAKNVIVEVREGKANQLVYEQSLVMIETFAISLLIVYIRLTYFCDPSTILAEIRRRFSVSSTTTILHRRQQDTGISRALFVF